MAFPRLLALGWCLALLIVSLYPFSGWHAPLLPVLDYLTEPFPRYYRSTEILLNLLAWIPTGFLLAVSLPPQRRPNLAALHAVLLSAALSFGIETTQNFLTTRIASNVDLLSNTLGAVLGALAARLPGLHPFAIHGTLSRLRRRYALRGPGGDWGILLLIAWLLTQTLPDTAPYTSASLLGPLGLPTPIPFQAHTYFTLETAKTATGLLATGLLAALLLPETRPPTHPIVLLLTLALVGKLLATGWLTTASALSPLTTSTLLGTAAALPLLILLLWLTPPTLQYILAGYSLLAATLLATLTPDNPYLPLGSLWIEPNFLQGHKILLLLSALWPFAALAWLILHGLHRQDSRLPPPRVAHVACVS